MNSKPRFVAIVGGSGSGKTWLAERLRRKLGRVAGRLSLDDFYRDRSHLPLTQRARINFDHPRAIDWEFFLRILKKCAAGEPVQLPRYDFAHHARVAGLHPWRPSPLILIDGLWLLRRPALRRFFDLRIFIDCRASLRFQRRLERDLGQRGRTRASVRRQFKETVAPMHDRFVQPQIRWADVVLSGAPELGQLSQLLQRIRRLSASETSKSPVRSTP